MPAIVPYLAPETLTIDKLKKELKKNGVALPPNNSRKAVYVQLYKDNVLDKQSSSSEDEEPNAMEEPEQHQASFNFELAFDVPMPPEPQFKDSPQKEILTVQADSTNYDIESKNSKKKHRSNSKKRKSFSAEFEANEEPNDENHVKVLIHRDQQVEDDPVNRMSTRRSTRLNNNDIIEQQSSNNIEIDDQTKIKSLTSGELLTKLKSYGIRPGPITDTTRPLYEKKLTKYLLDNSIGDAKNFSQQTSLVYEEESYSESEIPTQNTSTPKYTTTSKYVTPRRKSPDLHRRVLRSSRKLTTKTDQSVDDILSDPTETSSIQITETKKETRVRAQRSWTSFRVQILLTIALVGVIYFILQSMEVLPKNPLKLRN